MWGDLADRLGATDINATLEKIGNAVAPREDGDNDDEVSDGDYEYDDDEYEEDYDHDDEEGILKKVAGASPFRFAGMLTQALDNRHAGIGNSEESDKNSYTGGNNATAGKILFPREYVRTDNEITRKVEKNNGGNGSPDQTVRDLGQLPVITSYESANRVPNNLSTKGNTSDVNVFTGEKLTEALSNGVDGLSKIGGAATKSQKLEGEKETTSYNAIMAETKPPLSRTEMKRNIFSSTMKSDSVKTSSIMMGQVSTANESLKRNNEIIHVNKNIPVAQRPTALKECPDIPKNVLGVDSLIITGNKSTEEEEKIDITNENPKATNELALEGAANVKRLVEATKGDYPTRANENNNINATTNIQPKVLAPKVTGVVVKKSTERNRIEKESKISSEKTEQSDSGGDGIPNAIKASPIKSSASIKSISKSTPSFNDETPIVDSANVMQKVLDAESNCRELQIQLLEAEQAIEVLKKQAKRDKEKGHTEREALIAKFHSKEARLLQATSEESQNQTLLLEQEYSAKIQNLESLLLKERKESQEEHAEYKRLLRESCSSVDRMESRLKASVNKHEKEIKQVQQREERALRKVDDRMAQTMAVLDERDEEIEKLKKSMKNMESKVNEHQEGEEEAEEELDELHQENDSLRQTIEKLELEKSNLKDQVSKLKSGADELPGLQMELTMLKEERNRERTKKQAVMDSAMSSRTQLETERDNALSELRDSKQQLAATLGDLEVSRADYSRIIMANENLQSALEAFQDERRAEMEMIDEQRRESEEVIKSAHATATSAIKQIHENEMYEVQKSSDNAVKNVMHEMELVEGNLEKLKSENNQMRRSLDEAIHRLQTTQEDVIDRNVMKNILLDWCTLNDKSKRHQVLQVMANLLHFSEDEKEKLHLTSKSLDSVRAKVVGALAAPLPKSKADVEHLEGSNVHEKWVNFLMAETDDT